MTEPLQPTMLLDADVIEDPYGFYSRLRAEAPVWRLPGTPVVVVSSYALVTEALARVEDFSSNMRCLLHKNDAGLPEQLSFGDLGQQTLATADPPFHALHRRTVFPDLVAKRMLALEPEIAALATECVARAVAQGTTDFMATVGNTVPITVINSLIGFRDSDPADLLAAAFDSTAMLGSVLTRTRLEALIGSIVEVQDWIRDQLAGAVAGESGKVLTTIATGVEDGIFGTYEATVMLHTLLSAGGETTSSLLGSAVHLIAQHPETQQALRDDPSLLPPFIEEVLRLESPFRMMLRSVPAPTTLGSVALAPGDTVLLLFGAANRDPAQFPQPDRLDLTRETGRTHLAFGKGIHFCVGARLARLEAEVVLRELLRQSSSIEPDPSRDPVRVQSLLVRRHRELPVVLRPAS